MSAITIPNGIQLADDRLVDLIVLQWSTPLEHGPHCFGVIPAAVNDRKAAEFAKVDTWLRNVFDQHHPVRPLFIIIPEVSFPRNLLGPAENLIQSLHRPCTFIGGLSHLAWPDYQALLATCQMPPDIAWTAEGAPDKFVNAALVLIRGNLETLEVQKYLQLKIHPYNPEAPHLLNGLHTLVFRSHARAAGSRLDFAVKICSDFVNPEIVREFRRQVQDAAPGAQIDMLFVLQWQENPEAMQFKQGVHAFFEPPNNMVETATAAMLFVNNASPNRGRSQRLGGSRLNVRYAQHFRMSRDMASPTYVRSDEQAFDHQAIVLREAGPCAYHLTFKPVYLVNNVAGSGDEFPFRAAECAFLDEDAAALQFVPLQPICHWLGSEWRDDETPFLATLNDASGGAEALALYRTFVQGAHLGTRRLWNTEMGRREIEVRDQMQKYTSVLDADQRSPHHAAEPWDWGEPVVRAARRFMRALTLIRLAAPAATPISFPENLRLRNAMIGDVAVTFMWGNSERPAIELLGRFENLRQSYPGEFVGDRWMLIMVEPIAALTDEEWETWRRDGDITRATIPDEDGNEEDAPGDVVQVEQSISVLASQALLGVLTGSHNAEALQTELRALLDPKLHD